MFKIGDVVTRNSYNNDIIFTIIDIKDDIAYLKGIDVRLYADSSLDDLEKALVNYDNNFDPVLLKALLIHSANYTNINMDMEEKIKKMGFGKPSSTKEILYNSDYEITLVLRDNLKKGEFMEITDFPFPKSLLDNNKMYKGHIYISL